MANFTVIEHTVVSSYIREYPFATTRDQGEKLLLHVKEYIPKQPTTANPITIIASGALGLVKEVYEPLWDDLYEQSQTCSFSIASIWIADPVNLGASSTLNRGKFGDDPSWIDHSRDLFLLINHFRDQMPRPLVGIGHSCGGSHLANLAFLHPRLISTIVFLDPYIARFPPDNFRNSRTFHKFTVDRQTAWPSRSSAEAAIAKWPLYHGWDPRCLTLLLKYGLRPVDLSTESSDPPTTMVSLSAQEVHTMVRPSKAEQLPDGTYLVDRASCPDLDPLDAWDAAYRYELRATWERIVELRPSAKFILAGQTFLRLDELQACAARCGTGRSGSGGPGQNRVEELTIKSAGHFFPLQIVKTTAEECAIWLDKEVPKWYEEEELWREERDRRERNGERIGSQLSPRMREILDQEKLKPIVPTARKQKL